MEHQSAYNERRGSRFSRRSLLRGGLLGAVGVAAPSLLAACGGDSEPASGDTGGAKSGTTMTLQDLIAAANKEGQIHYGSTMPPKTLAILNDAFNKQFSTNIKVTQIAVRAADTISRVQQEAAAGKVTVDAFHVSTELLIPFTSGTAANSPFESFDWKAVFGDTLPTLGKAVDRVNDTAKGTGVEFQHLVRVIVYNTNLVSAADLPHSWEDLLDPKWKGKKLVVDPKGSCSYQLVAKWDADKVLDYSAKLAQQDPLWASNQDNIMDAVAKGEAPIGVTLASAVKDAIDAKEPVAIAPTEFYPAIQQAEVPVKGSPNLNAARLWVAWMATEGVKLSSQNGNTLETAWPDADTWNAQQLKKLGGELALIAEPADVQKSLDVRKKIVSDYTKLGIS